jgi:hypothetical protein
MSVVGYLVRPGPEWRTRKRLRNEPERDELGIKVEGAVLCGDRSLRERLAEDAGRAWREDAATTVPSRERIRPVTGG